MKVLLIQNNAQNIHHLTTYLAQRGIATEFSPYEESMLEVFEEEFFTYDMVIIDMVDKEDTFRLAKSIRKIETQVLFQTTREQSPIPIILMFENPNQTDKRKIQERGFYFVKRDFDPQILHYIVSFHIGAYWKSRLQEKQNVLFL